MLFLFKGCYNIPEHFLGSQKTQKIKIFPRFFARFSFFLLYISAVQQF